jgi:hypothetical protein
MKMEKLHTAELHNLYSSLSIIRAINSKRMRVIECVYRGEIGNI